MKKETFGIKELICLITFTSTLHFGKTEGVIDSHINISDSTDFVFPSVCGSLLISQYLYNLEALQNCRKIEGNLEIVRIEDTYNYTAFELYSFPKLQEITGFLALYRINNLLSLAQLFPNLSVIRGEMLLYNYALVVYEMQDLEEIGLLNLAKIMKGGVRVERNPSLCYLDTVDWSHIVKGDGIIKFSTNKDCKDVEVCPRHENGSNSCSVVKVSGYGKVYQQPRCWDSNNCQAICPDECGDAFCYSEGGRRRCCHPECVGGCRGPTDKDCVACANFFSNETCLPRCPPGTLRLQGRWCLTEEECSRGGSWYPQGKIFNDECLMQCPSGYADSVDSPLCVKCAGRCPRVCKGMVIGSISSVQIHKGCTVVDGALEILILGGNQVARVLEENLGMIEEVRDYVKIFQANNLMSLRFLKNLKVIRGENLVYDKYAFALLNNQNLQDIWDHNDHSNLTINKGQLFFHSNRKLCLSKIRLFVESVGRNFSEVGEDEISRSSNGDKMPCDLVPLQVNVSMITARSAYLKWHKINVSDNREILGYTVHFRKVFEKENVTMYSQRDACDEDTWKTDTVREPTQQKYLFLHLLQSLEPFTTYVVYVETYSISNAESGAVSPLLFFKTRHDVPSMPRDLVVFSQDSSTLQVRWSPPAHPHGIVTHYYVFFQPKIFDGNRLLSKNYCNERSLPFKPEGERNSRENATEVVKEKDCCSCSKNSNEKLTFDAEDFERHYQIIFENHLQTQFYRKKHRPDRDRGKRDVQLLPVSKSMGNYFPVWNATETILTNLSYYQEYFLEIVACHDKDELDKDELCSSHLFGIGMTLENETADDLDASRVKFDLKNGSELSVRWAPPSSPNGVVLSYEMELEEHEHGQKQMVCLSQKEFGLIGGHAVRGLAPGNWSFRIRSTSLARVGSWTKSFFVYNPGRGSSDLVLKAVAPVAAVLIVFLSAVGIYACMQRKRNRELKLRISSNPNYVFTEEMYLPDEWEIERSKVTCLKELGSGSFGKVYEGTVQGLVGLPKIFRVAIKTTHETASSQDVMCFLEEASSMKVFENACNHVVKLYGVVSQGRPPYVVMELMSNGDLREYLRCCRNDSQGVRSPPTLKQIVKMAAEIADGMAFLESKSFVHRDLASRNCLISENMVVKIADFGMTRDIYMTDYYRKGSIGMLPIRWMPKESIEDGYFDHKSDIWSYGVVLWEIVTLGHQPYMGLTNEQVCQFVTNGGCPNQPEGCHAILAELMSICWKRNPADRTSFSEILQILEPHVADDFLWESYYFASYKKTALEKQDTADTCVEESTDIPLENICPNGRARNEPILATEFVRPDGRSEFNHRGLPMPISYTKPSPRDRAETRRNSVGHESGDTTSLLSTPAYTNHQVQKPILPP